MVASAMPRRTAELLILLETGDLSAQFAVDWAVAALEGGFDSPSLRVLAGLDVGESPNHFEAMTLLEDTLSQLGFERPTLDVAARLYVQEVSRAAIDGELDPMQAADLIHHRVISPLGHPHELMAWCHVWEGMSMDCTRPLEDGEWRTEILKVAAKFAEGEV